MKRRRRLNPSRVADKCLERAWDDDVDNRTRKLLEQAHDVIDWMMCRSLASAKVLEIVEAELVALKSPLLNDEDPGMGL